MAGNAKRRSTYGTKIKNQSHSISELYALAGIKNAPLSSTMSFGVAGGSSTPSGIDTQGRLKTSGDSMVGAIAYYPKITVIDGSGAIDVERSNTLGDLTDNYTTYLIVTPVGVADDLQTISNPSNAGQLIHLEANTTGTITLKHDTGNIFMPSEEDYIIEAGGFATLIYDVVIHTDKWVLISSSSSGGANKTLSNLDSPTALNQSLLPDTDNYYDLGSETKEWARIYIDTMAYLDGVSMGGAIDMNEESVVDTEAIQFANVDTDVLGAYATITGNATGSMIFNVPTGKKYIFQVNEVDGATVEANGSLTCNGLIDGGSVTGIILNDASAEPDSAGQFKRSGADVYVYSGGASRNLSISGGASTALDNLTDPTSINQHLIPSNNSKDLGSATTQWRYLYVDTSAYIDHLSMGGSIDMNAEVIVDSGDITPTTTNTKDLGSASKNWQKLWVQSITASSGIDCDSLTATGAIYGNTTLTVNTTAYLNGTVNLGNASGDDINLKGMLDVRENTGATGATSAGTYNGNILSPDGYITIKVSGTDKTIPYYEHIINLIRVVMVTKLW